LDAAAIQVLFFETWNRTKDIDVALAEVYNAGRSGAVKARLSSLAEERRAHHGDRLQLAVAIRTVFANHYGEDLLEKYAPLRVSKHRHEAIWTARAFLELPLETVARAFNRSNRQVIDAVRIVEDRFVYEPALRDWLIAMANSTTKEKAA
jgi:hypothetical protein